MTMWRMKILPLNEWGVLQKHFGKLQIASGGDPSLAMFMKGRLSEPEAEIYLTGPGIDAIERLSPGGWEDAPAPTGENIVPLVYDGDPWANFRIEKPKR